MPVSDEQKEPRRQHPRGTRTPGISAHQPGATTALVAGTREHRNEARKKCLKRNRKSFTSREARQRPSKTRLGGWRSCRDVDRARFSRLAKKRPARVGGESCRTRVNNRRRHFDRQVLARRILQVCQPHVPAAGRRPTKPPASFPRCWPDGPIAERAWPGEARPDVWHAEPTRRPTAEPALRRSDSASAGDS